MTLHDDPYEVRMNREYNEYLGMIRAHDFGDALDSLWAGISCPTSLRSPEPISVVSAHSGDGQGRKEEEK